MPRREDPLLRERVFALVAHEGRGLGRLALTALFRSKYGEAATPSDMTIARYAAKFHALSGEEQRKYELVHWPETFERGDLPWEAQRAVLELSAQVGAPEYRPQLRLARWFWRVTLAAPELDRIDRVQLASKLTFSEVLNGQVTTADARWVEAYLSFRAWTQEGQTALMKWMANGKVPDQGTAISLGHAADADPELVAGAISLAWAVPVEMARVMSGAGQVRTPGNAKSVQAQGDSDG